MQDFGRGLRLFTAQPAFAWASVVTLALAIGANTLIFTIANVLVVKPLPFHDADRLGWILATAPGSVPDRAGVSLPEYAVFKDEASALANLAAWRRQPATLRLGGQSERVLVQSVIGDVLGLWGIGVARGRGLTAADERSGAPRVLVLSHRFWSNRFGGADDVVGRDVVIDGQPHTVVGVLTPDIELGNLAEIDLWLPHTGTPQLAARGDRGWRPVGRLRADATLDQADAQVAAIASRMAREFPETNRDWSARVGGTRDAMGGANTWLVLSLLAVVVGLLLLLACANIMNLLIARLIGRRHELAIRTALGATRGRVVRQIVGECLLLGVVGGTLGLGVAWGGLQGIHAVAAEPFFQQLSVDVRVVLFAVALSFIAPLGFAIVPTLRVLREDVRSSLNEGSTRTVGGIAAARGRSALVVLQVSLAVTLLVVAALVVQSMRAITTADPGYDPSKLLAARVDVAQWHVSDDEAALRLRQRLVARVKGAPGAQGAALTSVLPALQFAPLVPFDIDGRTAQDLGDRPRAGVIVVSADFFTIFGLPLMAGRGFEASDASSTQAVAVVSAEAARRYWRRATEALGATIQIADPDRPPTMAIVVGVARDTANPDLDQMPTPMVYVLDEHRPARSMYVVVRSRSPEHLALALRAAVAEVDADLPTSEVRTVSAAFADENSSGRLLSGLFAAFALVAILLAMGGLYGVMSYAVSQRAPEIAVRMALGASGRAIAGQVVGQSVRLAVMGTTIGLVCAYALASAVGAILYGVTASDPATYAGVVSLTLMASLMAAWLPMRRAATIDPLDSLRRT
jgi:putative ABC transport system permease protein